MKTTINGKRGDRHDSSKSLKDPPQTEITMTSNTREQNSTKKGESAGNITPCPQHFPFYFRTIQAHMSLSTLTNKIPRQPDA